VHLSVHPSAWASAPPSVATTSVDLGPPAATLASVATLTTPPTDATHGVGSHLPIPAPTPTQHPGTSPHPAQPAGISPSTPTAVALPAPTSVPGLAPISVGYLNYIAYQHVCAATALRWGRMDLPPTGLAESKNLAKQLMTQWGYAWPTVFDEEYPPAEDESAGIKYEQVTMEWVFRHIRW
jgi:hypothetical protein